MIELIHAYDLKYGTIYIYSPNLNTLRPYIENITSSVEDVFEYCKTHNVNVCYLSDYPIIGMYEYLKVLSIMKRYGFLNDKQKFFEFIKSNHLI